LLYRAIDPNVSVWWGSESYAAFAIGILFLLPFIAIVRSLWLIREIRLGKVVEGLSTARQNSWRMYAVWRLVLVAVLVVVCRVIMRMTNGPTWHAALFFLIVLTICVTVFFFLRTAWEARETLWGRQTITPFYQYDNTTLFFLAVFPLVAA